LNGESENKSAVLIMSACDMPLSKATDTTFALVECSENCSDMHALQPPPELVSWALNG